MCDLLAVRNVPLQGVAAAAPPSPMPGISLVDDKFSFFSNLKTVPVTAVLPRSIQSIPSAAIAKSTVDYSSAVPTINSTVSLHPSSEPIVVNVKGSNIVNFGALTQPSLPVDSNKYTVLPLSINRFGEMAPLLPTIVLPNLPLVGTALPPPPKKRTRKTGTINLASGMTQEANLQSTFSAKDIGAQIINMVPETISHETSIDLILGNIFRTAQVNRADAAKIISSLERAKLLDIARRIGFRVNEAGTAAEKDRQIKTALNELISFITTTTNLNEFVANLLNYKYEEFVKRMRFGASYVPTSSFSYSSEATVPTTTAPSFSFSYNPEEVGSSINLIPNSAPPTSISYGFNPDVQMPPTNVISSDFAHAQMQGDAPEA